MPRLDVDSLYIKRAYYFGVIALISFLVTRALKGVKRFTSTTIPESLFISISIVCFFCGIACVYAIVKAKNEANSFKKIIAVVLGMASFGYIILVIKELFIFF